MIKPKPRYRADTYALKHSKSVGLLGCADLYKAWVAGYRAALRDSSSKQREAK